uniref:Uncharacterized protein n=1 Tax=Solanum tuberosum TaxID=4113 RepID=M1DL97_SOLTU
MLRYKSKATEFHNYIDRSDWSYVWSKRVVHELANLSYESQQKGIHAPAERENQGTRSAILTCIQLRDHDNEAQEQVVSYSSSTKEKQGVINQKPSQGKRKEGYLQRFSKLQYKVLSLPRVLHELIHSNRVVHLQRNWTHQLRLKKRKGAKIKDTNLYKPLKDAIGEARL